MNQIAMRTVQLNHIKACCYCTASRCRKGSDGIIKLLCAHCSWGDEILTIKIKLAIVDSTWSYGIRAVLCLTPCMSDLDTDFGTLGVHAIDDTPKGIGLFIIPKPKTAWRDTTIGCNIGHLNDNQPHTTDGSADIMHIVPVIWHPISGLVLAHRRHDDAVFERQIF